LRTLVFWGETPLSRAKARSAQGAVILLWGRREAEEEAGCKTADFSPEGAARIEAAARDWADAVGERPILEGRPLRDLFSWQEAPLWPLARRFLRSAQSASGQCVRLVESFGLVFEKELPDEVEATGLGQDELTLLERCCTARGVLFQGGDRPRRARSIVPRAKPGPSLRDRVRALRSVFTSGPARVEPGTVVLVRPEGEAAEAFERLLLDRQTIKTTVVGGEDGLAPEELLDPPARKAVEAAAAAFERAFEELKAAASTIAAFQHEGVRFADLAAAADLEALLLDLFPAAVRRAEGLRSLLRAGPARVLCAAEHDTLALQAARMEKVPAVAVAGGGGGARTLAALLDRDTRGGMVG
jgi:hypothetical protein